MFGVLSEITIRVSKAFNLREIRTAYTLDECLRNLTELVEGHEYVKMWVDFYNNFCALYQTERTTDPITGNPGRIESFLMVSEWLVLRHGHPGMHGILILKQCVYAQLLRSEAYM